MRALRLHAFGSDVQVDEVPEPSPGSGEVLVRMSHVALNPLDNWVIQGTAAGGRQVLPFVIGTEGVGETYSGLVLVHGKVGVTTDGLAREVAAVPAEAVFDLPAGIDRVQAAALGVAGITAWRLVHDVAAVREDDVALVLGASGGVGSLLVQVLREAGCRVVAQTGSQEKARALRDLGVSDVAVSEAADLPAMEPAPTVIFDPLGGAATARAITLLAAHGRIVLFGASLSPTAELDLRALYRKAGSILGYSGTIEPRERLEPALRSVVAEVEAGRLRVPVDSVVPLEGAAAALRRIRERAVQGKIVVAL